VVSCVWYFNHNVGKFLFHHAHCMSCPYHVLIFSSWLQIQRSGFDSRRYQIFWVVVGMEQDPLSFVSTTEELPGRKSSGSGLERREYGRRDPSRWPRNILYPQKLALTAPTSGGRSVGIVRSRTKDMEFFFFFISVPYAAIHTEIISTVTESTEFTLLLSLL
jgi:hypothetical protein